MALPFGNLRCSSLTMNLEAQSELTPEEIDTYEIQASKNFDNLGKLQINFFYSNLTDSINLIEDLSRAGGERYANIDSSKVRGISALADIQPWENTSLYLKLYLSARNR